MLEGNYLRERPSGFFGFASTLCLRSAEAKQVLLLLSLLAEVKSTKNQTKNHLKNPYHQHTATIRIVFNYLTTLTT